VVDVSGWVIADRTVNPAKAGIQVLIKCGFAASF
jgi:hypothetical protein